MYLFTHWDICTGETDEVLLITAYPGNHLLTINPCFNHFAPASHLQSSFAVESWPLYHSLLVRNVPEHPQPPPGPMLSLNPGRSNTALLAALLSSLIGCQSLEYGCCSVLPSNSFTILSRRVVWIETLASLMSGWHCARTLAVFLFKEQYLLLRYRVDTQIRAACRLRVVLSPHTTQFACSPRVARLSSGQCVMDRNPAQGVPSFLVPGMGYRAPWTCPG